MGPGYTYRDTVQKIPLSGFRRTHKHATMCPMKTRISIMSITAAAVMTMSPAIASADPIDDALAKLPAGEITCEQAESYWTSESEYEAIRAQAQIVATFHERGDEITAALARIDEAADRCGLKDGAESEDEPATPAQPATPATPAQPAAPEAPAAPKTQGTPEHAAPPAHAATPATPAQPADAPEDTFSELLPKALDYFRENRDEILAYLPELSSEK